MKHGHSSPATPTYITWRRMKQRCSNPNNARYKYYGGKGIRVCKRWEESFEDFLDDMGERPEGMTIDRIDSEGDYEPSNCRWATMQEQSDNKKIRVNTKDSINRWAKDNAAAAGLRAASLAARVYGGMSREQALAIGKVGSWGLKKLTARLRAS